MKPTFVPGSADTSAEELLRRAIDAFQSGLVASTSFGIQSAVLLHIISRIAPRIPVIWIDTGYLPTETYQYADSLSKRFSPDLRVYQSRWSPARMEALFGKLWESDNASDLDRYHALRKVEPMHRALRDLNAVAWVSGIRREQTQHRGSMSRVMEQDGVVRVHPLFHWSEQDVQDYFDEHDLPRHPLEKRGYRTVGDRHLSAPSDAAGSKDPRINVDSYRESRFRGLREECGLHLPGKGVQDALFT